MLGLEQALQVVHTVMVRGGSMGWSQVSAAMSTTPARIAGLDDQGGGLADGAPANLMLFDPAARVTVDRDASRSLSSNNPWHGIALDGAVHATFLRGRATLLDGEVHA